ncbi:MAG: replication initiation protein [bacterium]
MKFNPNSAIVKKSNNLIFSKCNLTLIQQKIICVALSQIYKDDNKLKPFIMPSEEFLNILGLGHNYTYLKKTLKDFMNKPIEFFKDKKNWEIYSWFTSAKSKNGVVNINFNPELTPYLLNLKKKFTTYLLDNILDITSEYNIKLFEIFKSAIGNKKRYIYTINIDELKKMLIIEQMPFKEVKRSILNNINLTASGLDIEYKLIKQNKKVIKLSFIIQKIEKEKVLITNNKILFDYEKKWFIGLKESHLSNYIEMFTTNLNKNEILNELQKMAEWIYKKTDKLENKDWTLDIEKWLEKVTYGSNWNNNRNQYEFKSEKIEIKKDKYTNINTIQFNPDTGEVN